MTSQLVWASIAEQTGALVVLDATRRLYAGLSREGGYWHVIQPSQVEIVDQDTGEILQPAGTLACTCKGGTYHGDCWRLRQAVAFEEGQAAAPAWLRPVAPETELEKAAARG